MADRPKADDVHGVVKRFRDAQHDLKIRLAESTERKPENVAFSLDDQLRLVADIVQASILRDRARWLNTLVEVVKAGECEIDPFDQTRGPESSADAVVKLLCIYARMIDDDLFAETEEQFPQPTWNGKQLAFDAGQELLHECQFRCRGVWQRTKYPYSQREAFDGGVGTKPVEPVALVPTNLNGGLSFTVLESLVERWLVWGFGRVFGEVGVVDESQAQTANDESGKPAGESRAIQTNADPTPQPDGGPAGQIADLMNAKRSTQKGEGQAKLIAALTRHHKYADDGCLNLDPIGNNKLARKARVSTSTASAFFKKQFKGHPKYQALCRDSTRLTWAMKMLNQEFSPHDLYGAKPSGERDRRDDE